MKKMPSRATLIGDVVGSRGAADRRRLHRALRAAVDAVNDVTAPAEPLRITVGDEFQGWYDEVGQAVAATLLLRLELSAYADLRHGIGWGPVTVLDETDRVQDGPGWWAAREAIELAKELADRPATRGVRTLLRVADEVSEPVPEPGPVNAALMCRDQLVGELDERSRLLLRGLLAGRTQLELSAELGVSASAVSQRVRNDGLGILVASQELWT